jgi:hypothetical protein
LPSVERCDDFQTGKRNFEVDILNQSDQEGQQSFGIRFAHLGCLLVDSLFKNFDGLGALLPWVVLVKSLDHLWVNDAKLSLHFNYFWCGLLDRRNGVCDCLCLQD